MAAASSTTTTRRRRARKYEAPAGTPVDPRQLALPVAKAPPDFAPGPAEQATFVVHGPVARLSLSKVTWAFDRRAAALPLPIETALAMGTRALPEAPGGVVAKGAGPSVEYGLQSDNLHEYFLTKGNGMQGVILIRRKDSGEWGAQVGKTLIPYVLSEEAVEKGVMPPPGMSALPKSLERVVPETYKYWTAPAEQAEAIRNALVESGLFHSDHVKLVDGELRLCMQRLFLYEPDGSEGAPVGKTLKALLPKVLPTQKCACTPLLDGDWKAKLAADAKREDALLLLSPGETFPVADVVAELAKAQPVAEWMVDHFDTPENRAELSKLGRVFKLAAIDAQDRVFVASFVPAVAATFVEASAPTTAEGVFHAPDVACMEKREVRRVLKVDDAKPDERYVLGIVLEPETVDAQKDIYSTDEIRRTAHTYMEDYRTIGLMHKGAINDKVKILESFIAPSDFEIDGVPVKAGTWLMGVRVQDDVLWKAVKAGEITGFSIGGSALRRPDADTPPPVATA